MKLLFLGDSLTWGGYGGNWVAEIARLCHQHEIINAGVGGNTVINLLRRLEDDVIAPGPDGVFVMVGGNDAISYCQPQTRPYYKTVQLIPEGLVTPEQFTHTYRDLLTELQLNHIQTWIGLAPAEYSPVVVEQLRHYNARAAEVARALNVPVLDIQAHFTPHAIRKRPEINLDFINRIGRRASSGWKDYETERQHEGFTYTFDGLHLTPNTANQLARIIIDFLEIGDCATAR